MECASCVPEKVIEGEPFLGEPTEQAPVVYLSEQTRSSYGQALRRAGVADRDDDMFRSLSRWDLPQGATWKQAVEAAIEECERIGAALLIVDTLAPWAGLRKAEEDDQAAAEKLEPLQRAADRLNLAVLVLRHDRKGSGEVGESGRGTAPSQAPWTSSSSSAAASARPAPTG